MQYTYPSFFYESNSLLFLLTKDVLHQQKLYFSIFNIYFIKSLYLLLKKLCFIPNFRFRYKKSIRYLQEKNAFVALFTVCFYAFPILYCILIID